jgi:hypothetical protein
MTNEEQLSLFDTFTSYALDDLFWSLMYINSAVFGTPLAEDAKRKLLKLHQGYQAVLTGYYAPDRCKALGTAIEENNQFFVSYVESLVQGSSQAFVMRQKWRENGGKVAALLCEMNPYWHLAEWSAMIDHELDLLETITTNMMTRNYATFVSIAPICRRLAMEMSQYLCTGIEKQRGGRG